MKYLLTAIILPVLFLTNTANADYIHAPKYLTHEDTVYQIHDNKAYKVEIVDIKWYTTNQWFPLDQYGYTEEHVQKVKERQAKKANNFIKKHRGY